jgi:hypothetical protein
VTDRGFGDCWITGIQPNLLLWVKELWAERIGVPSADEVYMHLCERWGEVNRCANPEHVEIGPRSENARHALALKIAAGGDPRFGAGTKLTREQAEAIRVDPRLQKVIAAEYGISQSRVSMIKTGKSWVR